MRWSRVIFVTLCLFLTTACNKSAEKFCPPNTLVSCDCMNGATGKQQCNDSGTGLVAACKCESETSGAPQDSRSKTGGQSQHAAPTKVVPPKAKPQVSLAEKRAEFMKNCIPPFAAEHGRESAEFFCTCTWEKCSAKWGPESSKWPDQESSEVAFDCASKTYNQMMN